MNTRVCLLSHLASHHLRHAFVKVPTRHFLRLTPHVVVYDAHVRTVGDALVRLKALVGEISEQARLARAPLPDEHQLRPCDSLRSADNRLVVRLRKCAPASCLLLQHVGTLFCGCTALAASSVVQEDEEKQHCSGCNTNYLCSYCGVRWGGKRGGRRCGRSGGRRGGRGRGRDGSAMNNLFGWWKLKHGDLKSFYLERVALGTIGTEKCYQ